MEEKDKSQTEASKLDPLMEGFSNKDTRHKYITNLQEFDSALREGLRIEMFHSMSEGWTELDGDMGWEGMACLAIDGQLRTCIDPQKIRYRVHTLKGEVVDISLASDSSRKESDGFEEHEIHIF